MYGKNLFQGSLEPHLVVKPGGAHLSTRVLLYMQSLYEVLFHSQANLETANMVRQLVDDGIRISCKGL